MAILRQQPQGQRLWLHSGRVVRVVKTHSTEKPKKNTATNYGVYIPMKSILAAIGVAVTVLASVCSVAASSCGVQGTTPKPDARHRNAQEQTATARRPSGETPKPCDETNNKQTESQTVGWDPIICLHCPRPAEPAVFFLVGLLLATPIFLWAMRARTRKRESAPPKRFLQ